MSSSTIRYRDSEFVANDTLIEIWLFQVTLQMDADASNEPWLEKIRDDWRVQATSGFGFGPSPDLDKFLDSDDHRERVKGYFLDTLNALTQRGSNFTPDELSWSKIGGENVFYYKEIPIQLITDLGENFIALIS